MLIAAASAIHRRVEEKNEKKKAPSFKCSKEIMLSEQFLNMHSKKVWGRVSRAQACEHVQGHSNLFCTIYCLYISWRVLIYILYTAYCIYTVCISAHAMHVILQNLPDGNGSLGRNMTKARGSLLGVKEPRAEG